MNSPRLDRLDLKILAILQQEGRITNQRLAERVGLSASACLERTRRLERGNIITAYRATLDAAQLGTPMTVFALIALHAHGGGGQQDFETRLAGLPEAVECMELSGDWDYLVRFAVPDIGLYERLTHALLNDKGLGVRQIVSHIAMRTVKNFSGLPLGISEASE